MPLYSHAAAAPSWRDCCLTLPDGHSGLTSGCRLTWSVGNRSVPYQMLQAWCPWHSAALCCSSPLLTQSSSTCHVRAISRDGCHLACISSPGKVRRGCRYCSQGDPQPLFQCDRRDHKMKNLQSTLEQYFYTKFIWVNVTVTVAFGP